MNNKMTAAALAAIATACIAGALKAQPVGPSVVDPNLRVRTVASGLVTPVSMAFLGANDLLILEKNTGRVQRVVNGTLTSTVLDLAVNFASERGLLGIALHPDFPADPGVYLYWTCRTLVPPADPFRPDQERCSDGDMLGADTGNILSVPLLGNRVDRFIWNGATLCAAGRSGRSMTGTSSSARRGRRWRTGICSASI